MLLRGLRAHHDLCALHRARRVMCALHDSHYTREFNAGLALRALFALHGLSGPRSIHAMHGVAIVLR